MNGARWRRRETGPGRSVSASSLRIAQRRVSVARSSDRSPMRLPDRITPPRTPPRTPPSYSPLTEAVARRVYEQIGKRARAGLPKFKT
jgi:hypothetical protein